MNKVAKIIVAMILLFFTGVLMFVFIKNGGTGLIGNSSKIQWIVEITAFFAVIVVLMFLPKNIKDYPVKKKWLIGTVIAVAFMILFFVFFILSAFLFGNMS